MKILIYILLLLIVLILLIILESKREHKKFRINTYKIANDKIPDEFKQSRFVMISDFHNTFYDKNNEKVLNSIR